MGLLLWPGVLFYTLYWYVLYLVGAPFSALFLLYVPLVTLSAYATIAVVSSMDGEVVRRRATSGSPTSRSRSRQCSPAAFCCGVVIR